MKIIFPIIGVVLMSILTDVLLPSGQINKFIKGIFSLLLVLVIITPFAKLKTNEYELTLFDSSISYDIDDEYADIVWERRTENKERYIYDLLQENGYEVERVKIEGDTTIERLVITLKSENSTIKTFLFSNIGIEEERISLIYE